jgi:hypothetical protein
MICVWAATLGRLLQSASRKQPSYLRAPKKSHSEGCVCSAANVIGAFGGLFWRLALVALSLGGYGTAGKNGGVAGGNDDGRDLK